MSDAVQRACDAFEARKQKLTDLRRRVLDEIIASHKPIGAYEVMDRLAKHGPRPAPITVYRAIDALLSVGALHRLESRNAFFACHGSHAPNSDLIVAVCDGCGCVTEVGAADATAAIGRSVAACGFELATVLIEVTGRCRACGPFQAPDKATA